MFPGPALSLLYNNNHLKSRFVHFSEDPEDATQKANERRKQQAEAIAKIVQARMRPDSRYIVLEDMNDPPDSPWLAPMIHQQPELINGLQNPVENYFYSPSGYTILNTSVS